MTLASISAARYLAGSASLVALGVLVAWGSWQLRRATLPGWHGPAARLAEATVGISLVMTVAHLLGAVGGFRPVPMLIGCGTAALALGLVSRRWQSPRGAATPVERPVRRSRPEEVVVAVLAGGLVAAQWATHIASTWSRGMSHPDTLWYHAPFAARFVQRGRLSGASTTGLEGVATELHSFLPLDNSLVHGLGALVFGNDFLSPLVNVGWAALALLSAWSIGRRWGVAALTVLATVVVLGIPTLVGSQPGQAANDIASGALLFAAVALLLADDEVPPVALAIAGLAAGLALGAKLIVGVPVAVLTLTVLVLAVRRRRPLVAVSWCLPLALTGSFWFLRNWLLVDNPLPWFAFDLGPLHMPASFPPSAVIADFLTNGDVWRRFFLPGLRQSLTWAWPLTLGLLALGAAGAVVRGRTLLHRAAGVAVALGFVGYLYTSHSGDLGGGVFVFTVRYLAPLLFLGFTLLAVATADAPPVWRRALLLALALLVVVDATGDWPERMPAWPRDHLLAGVLVGAGVVVAAPLLRRRPRPGWLGPAAVAGAVLVAAIGGWVAQNGYLERRYVSADLPLDRVNAPFRVIEGQRVAVFGTEELYPMFGADLSNFVSKVRAPEVASPVEACRGWRERLARGRYDYIVVAESGGFVGRLPAPEWIETDPAVRVVVRADRGTVYRVDGALSPDRCG